MKTKEEGLTEAMYDLRVKVSKDDSSVLDKVRFRWTPLHAGPLLESLKKEKAYDKQTQAIMIRPEQPPAISLTFSAKKFDKQRGSIHILDRNGKTILAEAPMPALVPVEK
jgi:hypothetical protein